MGYGLKQGCCKGTIDLRADEESRVGSENGSIAVIPGVPTGAHAPQAMIFWGLVLSAALTVSASLVASDTATDSGTSIHSEDRPLWTASHIIGTPEPPPPYTVQRVFPHLQFEHPVHLTLGPSRQRYFLSEYEGHVVSFVDDQETRKADPFLELALNIFSIEFHPRFAQNPYVYLFGNTALKRKEGEVPHNQVLRFEVTMDGIPRAKLDSRKIILDYESDGHNVGEAKFGPDGYLYITSGDGTGDSDGWDTGQDVTDLPAAMLRIDVDHPAGGLAYGIPEDNPLLDVEGARGELWAYGFRNPWRFSFDRPTGDLYVGDVGQDLWEMIYLVHPGGNYGWSVKEGAHDFRPYGKRGPTPIIPPLIEHPHTESRSIIGGHVYHGMRLPELEGAYLYGDYETGKIWGLRHQGDQVTWHQELADLALKVASFGVSAEGEFLLIDHQRGELYELVPAPKSAALPPFPRRLSETGLFASTKQLTPAAGLIAYTVNSEQWLDGAEAQRYIGLPGESRITFGNSTAWQFTDGAVLVKTLVLPDKRVDSPARRLETQILTRQSGEWRGYSYAWNKEQTDARLVPAEGAVHTFTVADPAAPGGKQPRVWRIASRSECMVCHSRAAGFVLGLRTLQMNRDLSSSAGRIRQLRKLEQLDAFSKPLPDSLEKLPRLVDPHDSSAPLDARARSYLHANCAHCHVVAGGGNAKIVLTAQTKLAETFLVGGRPLHGDFGIVGAMLVAPGDPDRSVLYQRVSRRGKGQMPPLATNQIDQRAVNLLHDWIEQLEVPAAAREDVDRAFAQVQGENGVLSRWYVAGPRDPPGSGVLARLATVEPGTAGTGKHELAWRCLIGSGANCRVHLPPSETTGPALVWLARTDVIARKACDIQLSAYSNAVMRVWLNGKPLTPPDVDRQSRSNIHRFEAKLGKGRSRILVEITAEIAPPLDSPAEFQVSFRRKSANPRHERLTVAALSRAGNAEHGRHLILDLKKTQCLKCHRIGNEGGQVGPDLTGVGNRLSATRLIESILEPNRTVAPNYRTLTVELKSGRILTGILVVETPTAVTLKDEQAKERILSKSEIAVMQVQPTSLMPEGLDKSITEEEFVDLVAYLKQLTGPADSPEQVAPRQVTLDHTFRANGAKN